MEDFNEQFRFNVKYYREQKGWSQAELAIQADSSNGQIGNIESGKALPSFELLIRIAKALEIHPADLFLRDTSKIQNQDLYRKYTKLINTCSLLSEPQQTIVSNLAQSLAETTPSYKSSK